MDLILRDLILRCISNNPARRARAAEIVLRMSDMTRQFPPSFANRVEMLQRIKINAGEKQTLTTENQRLVAEAERHQAQVEQVRTEVTAKLSAQSTAAQVQRSGDIHRLEQLAQHRQEVIEWSELAHSIEIEQTWLRLTHRFTPNPRY